MNAMAASPYASTEETTNACRACRLLLGPCTDQMRDVLVHHVPPSTFTHVIKQKRSNLPRLTAPQTNLILPRGSSYTGNYNDMDIPLLYSLLRNICGISSHTTGWGNDPNPTDRSLSANIERIRIARNQCVHSSSPVLSKTDFNTIWSNVRSAVVDIDSFLNNGNKYEREVDFLRYETMDPDRDRHYIEELRKQAEEDASTREKVHLLKRELEMRDTDRIENQNKMLKIVDEITNTTVPKNVKVTFEKDVLRWKEDDKLFFESCNFPGMLEKVKISFYVTFVGVPGSGKTATARHIALMLQQEGYEIVPIKDIRKIEDYCDPNNPQVFVIDDVVGVFGLVKTNLKLLSDYQDRIIKPAMPKTKTLLTCREVVYRESSRESSLFFTDENNIVLLHSEEYALTNSDKENILKKHNIDVNLFSPASLTHASKMFPYLCKLYSTEKKLELNGSLFFENPVPCLLKELDGIKQQNKIHYVSLVLCMMNENKISTKISEVENETVFQNFNEVKSSILQKCKVKHQTDNFKFVDALSEMEGTYTKLCGTEYKFINDSMFEIVAYHFGCQFPELILQFMSSTFIAKYVKLQKCRTQNENKLWSENNTFENESTKKEVAFSGDKRYRMEPFDLCIRLTEDQCSMLADRLYRDIQNMDLYDVFMNNVLKQPGVCRNFIEVLKTKSYKELRFLFLSVQKNVSKVVCKGESVTKESEKRDRTSWEGDRQEVLLNERGSTQSVRVISWVIYYGHNQILQYLLKQIELQKEPEVLLNCEISDSEDITEERKNTAYQHNEQCRLLVLSCYSGDTETVRKLLKFFDRNTIDGMLQNIIDDRECGEKTLIAARKNGKMLILKEAESYSNQQDKYKPPLKISCHYGQRSGADVNLQCLKDVPLTAACRGGHISIVQELLEVGADVNVQDREGRTPMNIAFSYCTEALVHTVKMLNFYGANSTICDKEGLSPFFIALFKNNDVKMLLRIENERQLNLNMHLFDCLVNMRHSDVQSDSKDDVVVTKRQVWPMKKSGVLFQTIANSNADSLRNLVGVGLEVNQWIDLWDINNESVSRPLLSTMIDEINVNNRVEKVRILLEARADVNVRVQYKEIASKLDVVGVSVLERTQRLVKNCIKCRDWLKMSEYKSLQRELKKNVRRYSV